MCYSAQIVEGYRKYLRMTGAEIDMDQFLEILGLRPLGNLRIPRALDRWFDEAETPQQLQARQLIDQYRASRATQLQQEIFTQRKRLADAERKLKDRQTQAALESRRIATAKVEKALRDLPLYTGNQGSPLDARIFPFHYAPIVMHENGRNVIRLARYHCRQAGKPAMYDRKYPGLYNARRDNIDRFWRREFGHTHALLLVDSFFENVDREGRNAVLHFVPRPAETMLVACVYSQWEGPEGRLLSFAAITDEPPPEVAAAGHDRMIINIRPDNVQRWLTPQGRSDDELQSILSDRQTPYYEHEVLAA